MGVKEGETRYNLKKGFNYSNDGRTQEAEFIILREPAMEHYNGYFRLSQFITKSQMASAQFAQQMGFEKFELQEMMDEQKESIVGEQVKPLHEQVDEIEETAEDVEEAMIWSLKMSDIDIVDFIDTFRKMVTKTNAKKHLAFVDGNQTVPLGKVLWDRMHPDEAFYMAVRWCAFFVTAVDTPQKPKSGQPSGQDTSVEVV